MLNLLEDFSTSELFITNIKLLGLKKKAWNFSRGSRTYRDYEYEDGKLAVKDSYTYVLSDDNRSIKSLTRKLEWFDKEGILILEKDITPELNIKDLENFNREIRQGRLDYLKAGGEELAQLSPLMPEPYKTDFLKAAHSVKVISRYYEKEIESYIKDDTLNFENAVKTESNEIIKELLNLQVRPPDTLFSQGLTLKQSIIHQLTNVYPYEDS